MKKKSKRYELETDQVRVQPPNPRLALLSPVSSMISLTLWGSRQDRKNPAVISQTGKMWLSEGTCLFTEISKLRFHMH